MNISQSKDRNLLTLLAANLFTIAYFLWAETSIFYVLLVYWIQTCILGGIAMIRIVASPNPFGGLTRRKSESSAQIRMLLSTPLLLIIAKVVLVSFFYTHFSIFQTVHYTFISTLDQLVSGDNRRAVATIPLILNCSLFLAHHSFSALQEKNRQISAVESMASVYKRVIPMHLIFFIAFPTMLTFGGEVIVLAVFILLKTAVDVILYKKGVSHPSKQY